MRFARKSPAASVFIFAGLLSASAARAWVTRIQGSPSGLDNFASSVVLDDSGDAIAGGVVQSETPNGRDFIVVKLAANTANEYWRVVLDGDKDESSVRSSLDDHVRALVLSGQSVLAAGTLTNEDTGNDFAVVELDVVTGAEHWRFVIDGYS
jgi:hypothetical protein